MKDKILGSVYRHANILLLAVFCIVAAIFSDSFFTVRNITNILKQSCMLGILTIGLSYVLISGHMDLSIGAQVSFAGLMAITLQNYMPVGAAIICALAIGAVMGAVNGGIIILSHADSGGSLMITFGTNLLFSAICLLYTQGFTLPGSESEFYSQIGMGTVGRYISYPVIIFAILTVILAVIEGKTKFGRELHMTGYNQECCRLSGINTRKVTFVSYLVMGIMCAVTAIVLTSRVSGANPTAGDGYEMDAIVAAVLGGISLNGGIGSVGKAAVGVITLQVLSNVMNLLGFVSYDQNIVKGVVLILAISFDAWNRSRMKRA
ncbi:ABC transporter permease [Ruminococcus sp. 5_1_39BFAA]|uniref:ABC transporter permease n=1 Tax=Ruminococcus sp. 5_1_39BFAA TaxID=457412 RepID=UPI003567A66E